MTTGALPLGAELETRGGANGEGEELLAVPGGEVHEELSAVPWLSSARICALITHRVFETMVGRPPR